MALIVAYAKGNRGIGLRGALPWHLPEDLKRFKALTTGHAVIMGRKTHESIGRPLPSRRNVVVTRSGARFPGCEVAGSLDEALSLVSDDRMPFVIGGAQLYESALARATHLYVTEVEKSVEADTFFPALDAAVWVEKNRQPGETPGITFVDFQRKE